MQVIIMSISIIVIIGLTFKTILSYLSAHKYFDAYVQPQITTLEFIVVVIISGIIITPIITKVWLNHAIKTKVAYREFWNGYETDAKIYSTTCTKNGSCDHTYSCDPHPVTYSCNCGKNGCSTCVRIEYDDCPYVDKEYDYVVNTSVGNYTIDTSRFPEDPQKHRWRKSERIPQGVIDRAGVGEPPFWKEAAKRLLDNKPGYATINKVYNNYILASKTTILQQFSAKIDKYLKAGLLPQICTAPYDFYKVKKVYPVALNINTDLWNYRLNYLNAAVGPELQGDIHLVLVNANRITDFDEYAITLKSYWQSTKYFGKHALPKNAIVVILGTINNKTIAWSRAFTGMPEGNSKLVVAINNLKDKPFNPDVVLGTVQIIRNGNKFTTQHSNGLLETMLYDKTTRFTRMSMDIKDRQDGGRGNGYFYLLKDIEPDTKDKVICMIICVLLSCVGWGLTAICDLDGAIIARFGNKRRK